uniref:J domain-containing protein n=1 Tax=viral metagenome TaxID=1070528 RepID=A0A6C0C3Z0_9ZZZZ
MNTNKAYHILEIDPDNVNDEHIKKQYRLMALKFHPDKNKQENANEKFIEIQTAYEFLQGTDENNTNNYETFFKDFIYSINRSDLYTFLSNISSNYDENIKEYISKIDTKILIQIYNLIVIYKDIFYINDNTIEIIETFIKNNIETYTINTTLYDMLNANVYKIDINNEELIIPCWHNHLEYDNNLHIFCKPINNCENLYFDSMYNIYYNVYYNINDIFDKQHITFEIENKTFIYPVEELQIKNIQKIIFQNQGIPKINISNMLECDDKNNVIILLHLSTA